MVSGAVAPVAPVSHGRLLALPRSGQLLLSPRRGARTAALASAARPAAPTASIPGDFPFQTAQSANGLIVVHYYGRPASYGTSFVGEVQQALQGYVQPTLGYPLKSPVTIYVYNSRDDFLAGAQPPQPEITSAYAQFLTSTVYLPDDGSSFTFPTLAHELTHVVFHQHEDAGHLENDYTLYPRWLDEGMAESDVPDNTDAAAFDDQVLQQGLSNHQFINIFVSFVWVYPSDVNADDLSYAEARAFIKSLEATYGSTRFHGFVGDLADGNLDLAALSNFGADLPTLESHWLISLGQSPLRHAAGATPAPAPLIPYAVGQLPALANRTRPYAVTGGSAWLATTALQAAITGGAVLISLLVTGALALRRRRRSPAIAAAAAAPSPAPVSAATDGHATDATTDATTAGATAAAPQGTASAPTPAAVARTAAAPRHLFWRVAEPVALALLVPLALGLGLLWSRLDTTLSWWREYRGAAIIVICLLAAAVALAVLAWRARRVTPAHIVAPLALATLAALALASATPAGLAQGKAFEGDRAYALAFMTMREAGAPKADQARVQLEWAGEADAISDFPAAAEHYRGALALGLATQRAESARYDLLDTTMRWGTRLTQAHRYAEAVRVYTDQLGAASCDPSCQTALKDASGAAYLAWANDLIVTGHAQDGLTQLQALARQLPGSAHAATAQRVLANASAGLPAAVAVGKAGDTAAMNLLLELVAVGSPSSLAAAEASAVSQPVTGQLSNQFVYKTDVHIYFLAFRSDANAHAFFANYSLDTSLFKVVTTTDAAGHFSTRLPAGYTYVLLWEAAPATGADDLVYFSVTTIAVRPFTPLALFNPLGG